MRLLASLLLFASIESLALANPAPKVGKHLRPVIEKRQSFDQGEPINGKGKGAPILGIASHLRERCILSLIQTCRWHEQAIGPPKSG